MNIFKITTLKSAIAVIAVCSLFSCGSETTNTTKENIDSIPVSKIQIEQNSENEFYAIPSPIQQVQLLQKAGAKYDKDILNPLENITKYSSTNSKALNLGVYGADISYSAVFNQGKELILYLTASQKLAEELGVKSDFYVEMITRIEKNNANKDSLLQIVSDLIRRSNESLKENDQSHISVLVIAGGYIEGMYIGTQVAKTVQDKTEIYARIGELKGSLNNLIMLIATIHDTDISDILSDLKSIKVIYDETPDVDSKCILTDKQVLKITKQIKAIRIKITNL